MSTQETLTCSVGGHSWSRPPTRGRKPSVCPDHRPSAEVKAPKPKPAKVAQPPRKVAVRVVEVTHRDVSNEQRNRDVRAARAVAAAEVIDRLENRLKAAGLHISQHRRGDH